MRVERITALLALVLLAVVSLSACSVHVYGVPKDQWERMDHSQQQRIIVAYREEQRVREERRMYEEKRRAHEAELEAKRTREQSAQGETRTSTFIITQRVIDTAADSAQAADDADNGQQAMDKERQATREQRIRQARAQLEQRRRIKEEQARERQGQHADAGAGQGQVGNEQDAQAEATLPNSNQQNISTRQQRVTQMRVARERAQRAERQQQQEKDKNKQAPISKRRDNHSPPSRVRVSLQGGTAKIAGKTVEYQPLAVTLREGEKRKFTIQGAKGKKAKLWMAYQHGVLIIGNNKKQGATFAYSQAWQEGREFDAVSYKGMTPMNDVQVKITALN